jgi:hypothetical protein
VVFLSVATIVFAQDVYATKNGKKYHKAECPLVQNKDPQPISMKEATDKGLTPCGKCFKEELSGNTAKEEKQITVSKKAKKNSK